ncbi:MAG: 16S rRNA (cytidine(1402)-2'-O)-methyltransferase [Candidatus Phytoplasma stylosanthis]|uniref:16S rRNA (cytidine(1402)-2'-O)-methyltransferase n=1 Tax=Candidatus Phytoplasma stylosanthis TaxID=2798314 RepID=UPI00293A5C73|nr:16S rRNA (cytidine(1402)-2'-O)-methyltransferase [Candidatus Phytoplasma stylosanthis]MDV3167872.1 16S rRNA (cytidine(1402)-2'-O)-methyltransferase [Candidatus Phytoplasma stylosanthis]MDV3170852.1 16S rRNA (cytidine(1402)-2'-O)-methyltransferase [Candidatus Phytoplasma stylosanthis]MDV3173522.1 16S rRNA (cytidine(1402)-2'-O)-methyltransferase [Candidatus Phytoplasma stylosanthis]MDV3174032.1 16S rRNA (cytidine(1402)-2'-O)-methyltransferase [Candidatus Phytoplasma stylosanthis]MDV3202456.1 
MLIIQKTFTETKNILYLVSTPIGNMNDFSFRALETLKTVDYILAEDTRISMKILNFYNFKNKLISLHKYNEKSRIKQVLFLLNNKKNLALISDAGTPLINDPGFFLVKEVQKAGFFVTVIPGASAFLSAFVLSSFEIPFLFLGYISKKKSDKKKILLKYFLFDGTIIFYESAKRIKKTLTFIREIYGNRNISLSRELTKKFETIVNGSLDDILKEELIIKGEYVLVIEKYKKILIDEC